MNVEILTITGIQGNKITVTRGSNPKTTSLNAFNKTGGATTASYIIDPREEDDFSRTLYHHSFGDLFHTLRMTADASGTSITNSDNFGVHLLTDTWMETDYVLRPFHLAMSYDKTANRISLFVDGKEISTSTFSERNIRWSTIISTGSNTATVGSNGSDSLSIRRPSQFMGELHEFAITKDYKDRFGSIDTLIPNYRKTLLYFRFEEANL